MSPARRPIREGWRARGAVAVVVLVVGSLVAGLPSSGAGPVDGVSRASVGSFGSEGNGDVVYQPAITPDGRVVAFTSGASNLVPGDTNGVDDVFVHDRVTGLTERVSVKNGGSQSEGRSVYASLSADGRYVAFHTFGQLASEDTNAYVDVYVRDRVLRTTRLVSVTVDGRPPAKHGLLDPHSAEAAITPDGRYVAFTSAAANLVVDDTNAVQDVFVRDMVLGLTTRVSVKAGGPGSVLEPVVQANGDSYEPAISADGRFVAFHTGANNLIDGDNSSIADVMVHDRATFTTRRVSQTPGGVGGNGLSAHAQMTPDGRLIVYYSQATNLASPTGSGWDVMLYDALSGTTEVISRGFTGGPSNGDSAYPQISADGVVIAYQSTATNLVPSDANGAEDVFLYDRRTGTTARLSERPGGGEADGASWFTAIDASGTSVAFNSSARNLIDGDGNGRTDVFVWDVAAAPRVTQPTIPVPTVPVPTVPFPTLPPLPPTTLPPLPPLPVDSLVDCVDEPLDTTLRQFVECLTPATLPRSSS